MRLILKALLATFLLLLLLGATLLTFIDRTPLNEQSFYQKMMQRLDTLELEQKPATQKLTMAWGSYNITPPYPMPLAGSGIRKPFEHINDSLFTRVIMLKNGPETIVFLSVDLLILPPMLKDRIELSLSEAGLSDYFIYYGATHTHSGIGGWDNSIIGNLLMGNYDEEWMAKTVKGIVDTILETSKELKPGTLAYLEADASAYVINRLDASAPADGLIRGITLHREDNKKAVFLTYSAHPTSIGSDLNLMTGEYPAELIGFLENEEYDFAMFMAGMMGSHRLNGIDEVNLALTEKAGQVLAELVLDAETTRPVDSIAIGADVIPIAQGPFQMRLTKDIRVRDVIFRRIVQPNPGEFRVVQLGDILLVGTSCDFSGEISINERLDSLAAANGKHLIITSFNGRYLGYVTEDAHYDALDKEELRIMNWVGPYYGEYYSEMLEKIIEKD